MLPILPVLWIDAFLNRLPKARRKQIARKMPIRKLHGKIVAYKAGSAAT